MKLFDFHCDTPFALEKDKELLTDNNRHISLKKVENYDFIGGNISLETRWKENVFSNENCLNFTYNSTNDTYTCIIDITKENVVVPAIFNGDYGYKIVDYKRSLLFKAE